MQRNTDGSLVWLTFDIFAECKRLVHGVFLRHGGVSEGPFHSLNFAPVEGELLKNVETNRNRALSALNISHCCTLWQHHGKTVVQADPSRRDRGDSLTSNQQGLGLLILHADCQAVIFYDPIHHALSNVHCGWKGSIHNIYKETIQTMQALYNTQPEDLLVGISPSLGPEASEFIHYENELPERFYPFQFKPTYFDFWQIARWQLEACGVLPSHIEIASICTYANPGDFFSYRRLKMSGRNGTLAALF